VGINDSHGRWNQPSIDFLDRLTREYPGGRRREAREFARLLGLGTIDQRELRGPVETIVV